MVEWLCSALRCFCISVIIVPLMLFLQLQGHGVLGCLEEERKALLELKASMNYPRGCSLPSWDIGKTRDCCRWERVKCSNTTGRVINLILFRARQLCVVSQTLCYLNSSVLQQCDVSQTLWYLNASLFLPFDELQSLDLSWNHLYDTLKDEGFERLRALKKLEVLDLSLNNFSNSILTSISTLSSLKELHLTRNSRIKGLAHFEALKNLSNLESLWLGRALLDARIMDYVGALPTLKTLALPSSNLIGSVSSEGLKNLTRLEELYLSGNQLDPSIFNSLGALPNLKILDLSVNQLNGSLISSKGLKVLSSLESLSLRKNIISDTRILDTLDVLPKIKRLDLSFNHLNGLISDKGLKMLSKLEGLRLSNNFFDTRIIDSLGKLSRLKQLDLSFNRLNGSLPNIVLCGLKSLEELVLSSNILDGTLPPCLGNLTSLRVLDLSKNHFVGNIASSPIVNLVSLEVLILSGNQFKSLSPFSSFANHSKLLKFELLSGTDDLLVETEHPSNWIPTFQLKYFSLANCKVNMPTGMLPKFLNHQVELRSVIFASTNLQVEFPSWLLKNNTRLSELDLQSNSLTGTLRDLPYHSKLAKLIAQSNHFHGYVPSNIAKSLPNLEVLVLSSNAIEGHIPSSLGDMVRLRALDLSSNHLSGEVPKSVAKGCPLIYLKLSNNNLQGQLYPTFFRESFLKFLYLDANHFTGVIPQSLPNRLYFVVLDIRNNNITGQLASWIGDMLQSTLRELLMSKNHLQGPIPKTFCNLQSLEVLDLSYNNITGPILPCFSPPYLKHVNLRGNGLIGSMDTAFMYSRGLVTLDVGDNHITGAIPYWIGGFLELKILVLKGNQFQGGIPVQVCHLHNISMIDLSFNNLSGQIPSCLSTLPFTITSDPDFFFVPGANRSEYLILSSDNPKKQSFRIINLHGTTSDGLYEEFTTKGIKYMFQGENLRFVSGIDLSSNRLTGNISPEIGNLSQIHTLNLSHNFLTGTIPSSFSNLNSMESLDLSYNNLVGHIPSQLVQLNFLSTFRVAHNNLSGKTPDRKGQFATFEESSYEGNPFLCGPPLKNCTVTSPSAATVAEDDSSIDLAPFFASFAISFVLGCIGVIVVLYIKPYWRRAWFRMVDEWIISTDYFLLDCYFKLKHFFRG